MGEYETMQGRYISEKALGDVEMWLNDKYKAETRERILKYEGAIEVLRTMGCEIAIGADGGHSIS